MTPEEIDQLDRLQDLRERVTEMTTEIKDIEASIAAKYAVGVLIVGDCDEPIAVFEQPVKFSAKEAAILLADVPELLALVRVTSETITSESAKKYLPAETYAKCQIPNGKPKLKFLGGAP